jgi:type I restriction enzyme R subunit
MALFKQMIGRGTRLFPDEDKLSFEIIDYSGATALFSDPEFDGPPERVVNEEIDDEGTVVDGGIADESGMLGQPDLDFGDEREGGTGPDGTIDPRDLDAEPRARFYVDGVEVWITAEATYQLDPETQRLVLIEYGDVVGDVVRSLFPDSAGLRSQWAERVGRQEVLDALADRGIDADELLQRTGLIDADPLDVLVHLAWNQPLATRVDRARRVRKEHADFFEQYQPAAREVLAQLLDKYTHYGITELDDLEILQVPPISSLGSPAEIASRFGSVDALHQAVSRLAEFLYAA